MNVCGMQRKKTDGQGMICGMHKKQVLFKSHILLRVLHCAGELSGEKVLAAYYVLVWHWLCVCVCSFLRAFVLARAFVRTRVCVW